MNNTNTSTNGSTTYNPNIWNNGQSQTTSPQPPTKKSPLLIGVIAAMTTSLLAGGTSLGYKQWQDNTLKQERQSHFYHIQNLQENGQFEYCIQEAQAFPSDYPELYHQVKEVQKSCQHSLALELLTQAKSLAGSDQLIKAIGTVSQIQITLDPDFYKQAQERIEQWSNDILTRADVQYQLGELDTAVDWAKAIPQTVPVYQKAQQRIEYWQKTWTENQEHYDVAQDALNNGQFDKAIAEANQITTQHWQQKVKPIKDRANDEKYVNAAWIAIGNSQWHKALEAANKVTTDYGKQKAKPILDRVHDENHLSNAREALNNGQWNQAIAEANKVRTNQGKRFAQSIKDRANDEKHLQAARIAFDNYEWEQVLNELAKVKTEIGKQKSDEIKEDLEEVIGLAAFLYLLNEL